MTDQRQHILSGHDNVVRLELIAKLNGSKQAEDYCNNIAKQGKGVRIYNILLESYVQSKAFEKAESLIEQMRKLGLTNSADAYNGMLKVYAMERQYEKMDALMEQMNEKSVLPDKFSYNIRLNAYAATLDISGMENLLKKITKDHNVGPNLFSYTIAASGYIKAGQVDKVLEILKKLEELFSAEKKRSDNNSILRLYASIGRKEDLYINLNFYKLSGNVNNSAHHSMIASFLRDNDSWCGECSQGLANWGRAYDFRIRNLLIIAN